MSRFNIDHPDFKSFHRDGADGLPVLIFGRPMYNKPSEKQLDRYYKAEKRVRALGGTMRLQSWEVAGRCPVFSQQDIYDILKMVRNELPVSWCIRSFWNGVGLISFSVSIKKAME